MLSKSLEHDGQVVHNGTGDADTMIVECTIQFAREGRETTVVADDTDIIHAWSGCDTTSATYGHGKTSLLKKITKTEEIQALSQTISSPEATADQVGAAGVKLFIILYGGKDMVIL